MIIQNNFLYRHGSDKDRTQVKELGKLSYGGYFDQLTPDNRKLMEQVLDNDERLTDLLQKSTLYVCEMQDRIIGMAYLMPSGNPNQIYDTSWSHIRMVGVDPEFQGLGIARTLTRLCIDHATCTREKIIALHTSEMMDAARHIYESLGFSILKEISPLYGKRYWLYILHLPEKTL